MVRKLIPNELIDKKLCEKSLYHFVRGAWHVIEHDLPYEDNWHVKAICDHLEAVSRGEIKQLILNLCPGLGKSRYTCVYWPCWVWLNNPGEKWMMVSYSEEFALRDSGLCRDLIKSDWYQARWRDRFKIRKDHDTQSFFMNDKGGSRMATSISGGGTGSRVGILVCDDSLKIEDANSKIKREQVNNWTDLVMPGRGVDPRTYRKVIVQQRLHYMDQSGHLMAQGGWDCLHIPIWFEPWHCCQTSIGYRDPRTEEGELLWPSRFDAKEVNDLKKKYKEKTASILQQNPPKEEEGVMALFDKDNFRYFTISEVEGKQRLILHGELDEKTRAFWLEDCKFFQTADTALKDEEKHDYTVAMTFAVTPQNDLLVYDVARVKIAVPYQYDFLFKQRAKFANSLFMAVEDKASGIGLIQESKLRGTPFRVLKADRDKRSRCGEIATRYLSHKVFHLRDADWLADFECELLSDGPYFDQRDALAYGGIMQATDALLRAQFQGPGVIYPRIDLDANGQAIIAAPQRNVYHVNGIEVAFDDD